MARVIRGRPLVEGVASGRLLVSHEPISFWGGYDAASGTIIERGHPLANEVARGRVLGVPSTRGSSTTTAVLLEAVRAETAPAALLTAGADSFLTLAAIVADELYGRSIPVVALDECDFAALSSGPRAQIELDGTVVVD